MTVFPEALKAAQTTQGSEFNLEKWVANFDDRQLKEIYFDTVYAQNYAHGTDGHNARLLIARLASLCDRYEETLAAKTRENHLYRAMADTFYDELEEATSTLLESAYPGHRPPTD